MKTHILGEVSGLVTLAAFDTLSGTRFGTVLGVMALLLAVLACKRVDPFLGTITSSVTVLMAVYALHLWLRVAFDLFLLAMLPDVSTACISITRGDWIY